MVVRYFSPVHFLSYNVGMARGWESKNIEDQISAAEAKQEARLKENLTSLEVEQQKRKASLQLERARLVREIEGANNARYVALLKRSLSHIETELAKLEPGKQANAQTSSLR